MSLARVARHWKQSIAQIEALSVDEYNWLVAEMRKEAKKS